MEKTYGIVKRIFLNAEGALVTEKLFSRITLTERGKITKDSDSALIEGSEFTIDKIIHGKTEDNSRISKFLKSNHIYEFEDDEEALLWYRLHGDDI
jgi:hypothetical protein